MHGKSRDCNPGTARPRKKGGKSFAKKKGDVSAEGVRATGAQCPASVTRNTLTNRGVLRTKVRAAAATKWAERLIDKTGREFARTMRNAD